MTKKLPTIVYFGNEQLATGVQTQAPLFKALLEAGYKITALVLSKSKPSREKSVSPVEGMAREYNIPVLTPQKSSDIAASLEAVSADAGVLAAYGKIVPEAVINLFPAGIVNIHPSLLPKYRGSTPIEQALLDGIPETGVSLMALAPKMDAGGIYSAQKVTIPGNCSKQKLYDLIVASATTMLVDSLPKIISGELTPQPQDEQLATYTTRLKKEDGIINWQKPAAAIEREIRAYAGWPGSRTVLNGIEALVTGAHVVHTPNTSAPGYITITNDARELHISTLDGFLAVDRIKPAGKSEMDVQSFINGYRSTLLR